MTRREFGVMAHYEAARRRADPARVEKELVALDRDPARFGLSAAAPGLLTTAGIERSRAGWGRHLAALAAGRGVPPRRWSALAAHARTSRAPDREVERAVAALASKALSARSESPALKVVHDAYKAGGGRVFVVSAGPSAARLGRLLGSPVHDPDALAARLGKTPAWEAFLELRRHRWRSLGHAAQLARQARRPPERLTRRDLVVLDARGASHHALAAVAAKAAEAGATVVAVSALDVIDAAPARKRTAARDL